MPAAACAARAEFSFYRRDSEAGLTKRGFNSNTNNINWKSPMRAFILLFLACCPLPALVAEPGRLWRIAYTGK